MQSDADKFYAEVERFLAATGMSATRFGFSALGDTKFVWSLRKGRKPRGTTITTVREWMSANQASVGAR